MQDIIELSDGWFLLGWWLLAVGGGWLSGRIRGALELPGDRDTGSRESVSPYDVAFLRAGGNWAGDAALFSLLHAGVVRVDEDGKLRRGPKALPDDAPEIERYVLERAAGLDAKSTPVLVLERAWTHHVERLQRLGLLPSKSVRLASRFAQGCVLAAIAVVAMTWLRHNASGLSLGVVALVASLALFGLVSVRVLRNTLRPTRSGRSVLARIDAAVDLPHSLRGWPAPDVPAAQISFVMSAFGFSAGLGGACRRYRTHIRPYTKKVYVFARYAGMARARMRAEFGHLSAGDVVRARPRCRAVRRTTHSGLQTALAPPHRSARLLAAFYRRG